MTTAFSLGLFLVLKQGYPFLLPGQVANAWLWAPAPAPKVILQSRGKSVQSTPQSVKLTTQTQKLTQSLFITAFDCK